MGVVYLDGAFVPDREAFLPITDRGFLAGDGAYATIHVRDGVPLFLQLHLEQLRTQCFSIHLSMPHVTREIIDTLILKNEATEGIWRLKVIATGGDAMQNRLPKRSGRIVAFLEPFTPLPFKPLNLGIFPIPYSSCHAGFKSLSHLNRYYVMEEAYQNNWDDCVTVTESGCLLEASFGNLLFVKEKKVFTPDPSLPLYFGITLRNTLAMAQKLGFEIEYVKWKLNEIPKDCMAVRTNTMQCIRPIEKIGDRYLAQNPTLLSLFVEGYAHLIQQEQEIYKKEVLIK